MTDSGVQGVLSAPEATLSFGAYAAAAATNRDAVRSVPERQRLARFRSVYEGRSWQATADELELTANGVAQLLWRARKSLADALDASPGAMLP